MENIQNIREIGPNGPQRPRPRLDIDTERATRSFMRRLAGRYSIREAILFGSRARQTHRPDSDADIAVVLEGEPGSRTAVALDMAGIAFDVLMETGILVEALPLWANDFQEPGTFRNLGLLDYIQREGLRL
jgi:predicted nucleotidyltransferase